METDVAFIAEVQAHCPHAAIVYDLFHVLAKYGREVINRVRVPSARLHSVERPDRRRPPPIRDLGLRRSPARLAGPSPKRRAASSGGCPACC